MLSTLLDNKPSSPCVVTLSKPSRDLTQPIKLPASVTNSFIHTLDLILPKEVWETMSIKISEYAPLSYSRVEMSLLEVISGLFFDQYIKKGSILMISFRRPLVENCFSIREGILTLELDKQTYERCGLQGEPIKGLGRFHQHQRFRIMINLREPTMIPGKKRFDRLIYAFTKVLIAKEAWLFLDLQQNSTSISRDLTRNDLDQPDDLEKKMMENSIDRFQVESVPIKPRITHLLNTSIPDALCESSEANDDSLKDFEYQSQLLEFIGLMLIHSPRVTADDHIDSSLSLYQKPEIVYATTKDDFHQDLIHVSFQGLLPLSFVRRVLKAVKQETEINKRDIQAQQEWWISRVATFEANTFIMTQTRSGKCLEWDVQ